MTRTIAVVGSLNVDRTLQVVALPAPGETVHALGERVSPGGKGANQAVAAARVGASVRLVGAVGADDGGAWLRASAAEAGVAVDHVQQAPAPTGEALVLVDERGENLIVVNGGANRMVDAAAARAAVAGSSIVVANFEVSDPVLLEVADAARDGGARFVLNPSPSRPIPQRLLEATSILVVNESELAALCGVDAATDAALLDARRTLGVEHLVVTLGARGAAVVAGEGVVRVASPRVDAVDTSGCGDAFMGALVARLADGDDLVEAVRVAVAVGAYAATRWGTQSSYPTRAELDEWLATRSQPVSAVGAVGAVSAVDSVVAADAAVSSPARSR